MEDNDSSINQKKLLIEKEIEEAKLVKKIHSELYERQLKLITLIFSFTGLFIVAIGIFMGILTASSSSKIDNAISNMNNNYNSLSKDYVDKSLLQREYLDAKVERDAEKIDTKLNGAINDLNIKFEKLAGEAFKVPILEIFHKKDTNSGDEIVFKPNSEGRISINDFLVKNRGDRPTQNPSLYFYFNQTPVGISGNWEISDIREGIYVNKIMLKTGMGTGHWQTFTESTINPGETRQIPYIEFDGNLIDKKKELKGKVVIYYSNSKPAEKNFRIEMN